MGWGRKSHFYCEVKSSRAKGIDKICSTRERGLHATLAGWYGAIEVSLYGFNEDRFTVTFMPWEKSEAFGSGIVLANGALNYDQYGPKLQNLLPGNAPMVRLDQDVLAALEFVRAKQIMMEGIDT